MNLPEAPLGRYRFAACCRYVQPSTEIQYVLDWTRGADVDLGCGTMAVGDSTQDPFVSKNGSFHYDAPPFCSPSVPGAKHPNSMHRVSYQWSTGQRGGTDDADPGYYFQRCPR